MSETHSRLYIFTGKGGVGKTTLAMAFTKYLESIGKKVRYNGFYQNPDQLLINSLALPHIKLEMLESAEKYVARKLNSTTVASWIMKTHFFKSLFQMIPGLGHMILLGNLIDELEKDPDLIIVLDSPASGHALTMFESSSNFKKIFRSGLIVKDIERMQNFLNDRTHLKTLVVTLATELSLMEARDLQAELETNLADAVIHCSVIVNDSFKKFFEQNNIDEIELPEFLKQKIELEKHIVSELYSLPHIDSSTYPSIILNLAPLTKDFV